ncbi:type I-E CRISPR-associated protein Cas6/Cse3/CasE [Streptomyces sp. NPDC058486]|uniref:type I-E CRISPR-associated protein Cas6/Cse3/CasE n=1 Tax=unclassified Streptomyces TaxID=2593676 RepID=UPI00365C0EDA
MTTARTASARFVATQTLLTLDAKHPYIAKSLIDAQDMHRNVMSGFRGWVQDGDPDARAQMGVLSTWTLNLRQARLSVVVQSQVPGDWQNIPRDALVEPPETLTVDRTFTTGETVSFRAVVNPVYARKPGGGPAGGSADGPAGGLAGGPQGPPQGRGIRTAHTRPDHVKKWFTNRLDTPAGSLAGSPAGSPAGPQGGARLGAEANPDELAVRMLPTVSSPAAHKGIRIVRAEIQGKLTVTDPRTFVTVLGAGLGRGRAYGCGLILVR